MKARRQRLILSLVESSNVRTHDELGDALARRGISVSQGTLSRDLRELGIAKGPAGYVAAPAAGRLPPAGEALARAVPQFLVGTDTARNLVVLRTHPGGASALAQYLDDARWPEVVGTLAGDDTIFVATKDSRTARIVRARIDEL